MLKISLDAFTTCLLRPSANPLTKIKFISNQNYNNLVWEYLFIIEGLIVQVPIILYLFFIFYFYKGKRYFGKNEKGINEENRGLSQIRATGQAVKKRKNEPPSKTWRVRSDKRNQMNVVSNVPSGRAETGDWPDAATRWRTSGLIKIHSTLLARENSEHGWRLRKRHVFLYIL